MSFFYFITFKLIDRGLIEFFGPLSIVRFFSRMSYYFSRFQNGFIYHYIFIMLLGIIFILFIVFINLHFLFFFNIYLNLFLCSVSVFVFLLLSRNNY